MEEKIKLDVNVKEIKDSVNTAINENFIKLKGVNAYFDSIYELIGFDTDFRKDLASMKKDIKEMPQITILSQLVTQLKVSKNVTQTEREKLQDALKDKELKEKAEQLKTQADSIQAKIKPKAKPTKK